MLKRFWRYLVALLGENGPADDARLAQAQREMEQMHARERAVQTITQRNHLQDMMRATQRRISVLEGCADLAEATGDMDEARRLRREKADYEEALARTRASLQKAADTVEEVKQAIRDEEERIRRKTADALLAREAWKRSQGPVYPPDAISFLAAALLFLIMACCFLLLLWYR